jgi:hypothetical protein
MSKQIVEYQKIFIAGGFPEYTYNPRESYQLEDKLAESLKNLCKLIVITGHTKSGKTVLARKILPYDKAIWVDGGTISQEDEFWQIIVNNLNLTQGYQKQVTEGTTKTLGVKGTAEAGVVMVKATGQFGWDLSRKQDNTTSSSRNLSSRVVALQGLKANLTPLLIDDFHYLPNELQANIVRALKQLIFDGLPVVIIAIPHRRYDAMKVEREMTGRIMPITIPVWSEKELQFIPDTGFSLLGYTLSKEVTLRLVQESIGSPHLMQDFCRTICRFKDLHQSLGMQELSISNNETDAVFHDVAQTMGRPMFEKLARGPQRTDRIQRELIDGKKVDIYQLVLRALANLRPGLISLEYPDIRESIRNVAAKPIPQLQEIARVLKHMSEIAATDRSSTPVLDFNEEEKKLHITDPFFAFYLRWGDLTL